MVSPWEYLKVHVIAQIYHLGEQINLLSIMTYIWGPPHHYAVVKKSEDNHDDISFRACL